MIAPNKQNLIILKNQQKTTQNGYKLLKEKRAGLIMYFLELSKKGKILEKKISEDYSNNLTNSFNQMSRYDISDLNARLATPPTVTVGVHKKRVSGVIIDLIDVNISSKPRPFLKKQVQSVLTNFSGSLPSFIELIQLKLNCKHIADEILKTSRQIANLEKKIESTAKDIKYIKSILSDKENLEKGILMKLFL